jgi:hypothetical protein
MDSDRDLKQDTYRDGDADAVVEAVRDLTERVIDAFDTNPVPNIVLHPGDTLALGAYAGDANGVGYVRLLDRNGVCYAVLDCERDVAGHGWLVHAIRYVADRGRGVLPVRADTHPNYTNANDIPVPDAQPVTIAAGGTVTVEGPLNGPYEYVVTHYHQHTHARAGESQSHTHQHAHAGADARRANELGHTADVHAHQHNQHEQPRP